MNLETDRLVLRNLSPADAPFILEIVNDPSWLRFIGDKKVRTLEDARSYIARGPQQSYERHGFGLLLVQLKTDQTPVGICGLIKRESLPDVDIGFAFLPQFRGKGYAFESAAAVITHGKNVLGLQRILAIVTPDNKSSIKVLERLGLRFLQTLAPTAEDPELLLYG